MISLVGKTIGLVVFQEEIAFFVMTLKDRGQNWKEYEEEEETAPWWFETQNNTMGAKGENLKSKKIETSVYQSNIRMKYKLSPIGPWTW